MIDSEQVPWGKGEKQAGEAVEIEPETVCLQGTELRKKNSVPIEEWSNDLYDISRLRTFESGGIGKPSVNSAY